MLPAKAEGGGFSVMVGASVMVGVVAVRMADEEVEEKTYSQKKREKYIIILYGMYVRFIILSYVISKSI